MNYNNLNNKLASFVERSTITNNVFAYGMDLEYRADGRGVGYRVS
jgi:hypothetical protein